MLPSSSQMVSTEDLSRQLIVPYPDVIIPQLNSKWTKGASPSIERTNAVLKPFQATFNRVRPDHENAPSILTLSKVRLDRK
jgi:hypothetical protein